MPRATRVARQLDIGTASLRLWARQAEIDGGTRPRHQHGGQGRIAALAKDNRLRWASEILTSAATFVRVYVTAS